MALRMPLLLLFFFLLAPASSKFEFFFPYVPWVDPCDSFAPNTTTYNALTDLSIVLDESVGYYLSAKTFDWLFCINRLSTGKGLNVTVASTGERVHISLAYDRFWRYFHLFGHKLDKARSKDACKVAAASGRKALVFTWDDDVICPDNNTFTLQLDMTVPRNYTGPCTNQTQEEPNRYRIDLQTHCGIRKLHELAFRLGGSPAFNGSSLSIISTPAVRGYAAEVSLGVPKSMLAVAVLAAMLIAILIFFFCLITLVNVNEHFLCVMEELIRARVRRQRALMREEGEEGEAEEGEEAVEQRPNRRRRLNSEEQSLLGTDESTIRTALSGRFSSLNSLSFHSTESRPRRVSLDSSLDEVVVEPSSSDDVTTADSRTATDNSKQSDDAEKK